MLEADRNGKPAAWRWLVPTPGDRPLAGRRPADWLTDSALFGFAVALGGLAQAGLWHSHAALLDGIDLGSGLLACLALWRRRANPVVVMLLAFGAAWFSPLALGAGLVAIGTAASRMGAGHFCWSRCSPCSAASCFHWSTRQPAR
jgi:hypothetical protein